MAGFKGFGFTSPEEIIAQTQQGFQQALQSGNPNQMRAAVMQQAAFALGGSPELRKARQVEKVLKSSYGNLKPTGDEMQDQLNFYKAVQKQAIDSDLPEIALQATEHLATLRLTEEERSRLKSRESREVAQEKRDADKFSRALRADDVDYAASRRKVVVDSGNNDEYLGIINLDDPEANVFLRQQAEAGAKPILVSEDDYFDATSEERLYRLKLNEAIAAEELPPTTDNRYRQYAQGNITFIHATDQLIDIIDSGPEALTAGGKTGAILDRLGQDGRSLINLAGQQSLEEADTIATSYLDNLNIKDQRLRSAAINMAYAIASSRESGKLSESDVKLAAQTLGIEGQPNPGAALTVLKDIMDTKRKTWTDLDTVLGLPRSVSAMESWRLIDTRYTDLDDKLNANIKKWRDGAGKEPPPAPEVLTPLDDMFGGDGKEYDPQADIDNLFKKRPQ